MSRIKINVDPYVFSENTDGTFKLRLVSNSTSINGLHLENGILYASKGVSDEAILSSTTSRNKVGNGIAGNAYEECNGPLGCASTVSRRLKAPSTNPFAIKNEGVYIPDIIRHLNSNYGDD